MGVQANDITVDSAGASATGQVYLQGATLNASETATLSYYIGSNANISDLSASVDSADATANITTNNGGFVEIEVTANSDFAGTSDDTIGLSLDGFVVNGDGLGEVTYTQSDGTKLSDTYRYSVDQTGTVEIGNYTTSDDSTPPSEASISVVNSSGEEVYSAENQTQGDTFTLDSGDYTIDFNAIGYDGTTEEVSVTAGETVVVSPTFTSSDSTSEPATGTVALGNIGTWDNQTLDSVDTVMVYNSSGDRVVNADNITDFEKFSKELDAGDYTFTLVADGYADADGSFSISENSTTELNPEFGPVSVDYEFTVEQDGDALNDYSVDIYDGNSIGENETPLASAEPSNDSNTIRATDFEDGSEYTLKVSYTDANGNETSYTETFTADASADEDGDGVVSQTVDVSEDDSTGVVGGAGNIALSVGVLVAGAIVVLGIIIGPFAVVYILISGVRKQF